MSTKYQTIADNDKMYFIVRVWNLEYNKTIQYQIIKDSAYTMDQALNIKMAQEIMETNPDISYQLQKVSLMNVGKSSLAKAS